MARVLLVDDEAGLRFTLSEILEDAGHEVVACAGAREALKHLGEVDLVLTDLVMPGMDGMGLLEAVGEGGSGVPVLMLTARGSERIAVRALRAGAFDYLTKPFDVDEVLHAVGRAEEVSRLRRRVASWELERALGHPMVAESPAMQRLLIALRRVAGRDVTVLVRGETGTGKELVGSLLHGLSARASRPLVRFNCAAINEELAEAELFGYTKGSFTGALRDHDGFLRRADGGTLVLDEVGELSAAVQAKLLRVLQEGEVQPIGARRVESIDVRVVACTNRDLKAEVEAGRFRADLYYRLAVVEVEVPALRTRREDIGPLAELFRRRYAERFGVDGVTLSTELVAALRSRPWLGNVRELENTVARMIALSADGRLGLEDLDADPAETSSGTVLDPSVPQTWRAQMSAFERGLLEEAMKESGGNQSEAARRLGVSRTTLIDKLKRFGLYG